MDHVDQVQEFLGRQMLLENPSTYLAFGESTYAETDFIAEVVRQTGCGLLLDVNNVYVSSINQQWDPFSYIEVSGSWPCKRSILPAMHGRQTKKIVHCLSIPTTVTSRTSYGTSSHERSIEPAHFPR